MFVDPDGLPSRGRIVSISESSLLQFSTVTTARNVEKYDDGVFQTTSAGKPIRIVTFKVLVPNIEISMVRPNYLWPDLSRVAINAMRIHDMIYPRGPIGACMICFSENDAASGDAELDRIIQCNLCMCVTHLCCTLHSMNHRVIEPVLWAVKDDGIHDCCKQIITISSRRNLCGWCQFLIES